MSFSDCGVSGDQEDGAVGHSWHARLVKGMNCDKIANLHLYNSNILTFSVFLSNDNQCQRKTHSFASQTTVPYFVVLPWSVRSSSSQLPIAWMIKQCKSELGIIFSIILIASFLRTL